MSLDRKKEWNNNFLKKLLYVMLRYPEEYWAQRRFAHMRMKYLEMTLPLPLGIVSQPWERL